MIARIRERLDRGERVEPEREIAAHPQLAEELRSAFALFARLERTFAAPAGPPPLAAAALVGTLLGPYRLVARLGGGGMGEVFLAEATRAAAGLSPGARVALKVVHPHLLARPAFVERFRREAQMGRAIRHENVVRTLDEMEADAAGARRCCLVMEYVEGQTLRALLDELGHVPEDLCRHVGREVSRGLAALHAGGVVHRDVKPENVIVTRDHVVKLMDLGVAQLKDAARLSQTSAFVGSFHYAAPEQFRRGGRDVDGRADLFALGLVLYEIASGVHPHPDDDVQVVLRKVLHDAPRPLAELNPQLSPFFEEVVAKLLSKAPDGRFGSARELASVLESGEDSAWWRERSQELRAATRRPLRRMRVPRETALYGRDGELAKLRELFDRTKAGEGQALLLEGEAGIGKSRLVDEFVGRLQQAGEDVNLLFGSYPPGGAATASGAFSTAYREHLGDDEAAVRAALPQTPLLVPAFAALLRGDATPPGAEPLTRDSLQTVFVHATRAIAADRPTVVLIDDLHFAPQEGRALFASLALAVPGHRILLVGCARPGLDEAWVSQLTSPASATHLTLPRLGPKELVHLLRDALRSERLAEELSALIALKSDGNPFFVFELLRGLRDGQFLVQKPDGTWDTTQVIRDIRVPSSIAELVQARVADLADEDRHLLDVAACCGYEFDPLLVGEALGLAQVPVMQRLARIEKRHRLVRSVGRRYVFDHHQVQEALYDGLPELLREPYHAAIAGAIVRRHQADQSDPKDLDGAVCVELADHSLRGGKGEQALRYLDAALTYLEGRYLNHSAIRLARAALAPTGLVCGLHRARLLQRLADRLDLAGRRSEQESSLREALGLTTDPSSSGIGVSLRCNLGWCLIMTQRLEEARGVLEEGLAIARERDDLQGESMTTCKLGLLDYNLGRYAASLRQFERHLALARRSAAPREEACALGSLGLVLQATGDYGEALARTEAYLGLVQRTGDRQNEGTAIGNLGILHRSLGQFESARTTFERALRVAREIGDRRGERASLGNLGILSLQTGHYDDAQPLMERQLALARELQDRRGEAIAHGNLSLLSVDVGRFSEAERHLERYSEISEAIQYRGGAASAALQRGILSMTVGRYSDARSSLEQCLAAARELHARQTEAHALGNLGSLYRRLGRYGAAREHLVDSLALHQELGAIYGVAHQHRGVGVLHLERHSLADAREHLGRAVTLARQMGARPLEAETLADLGATDAAAGETASARAALDAAASLAEEVGAPDALVRAVAVSAEVGGVPRLGNRDGERLARLLRVHEQRLGATTRMQADLSLWRVTGDRCHLERARARLEACIESAPADCRATMSAEVPLHREILAAAGGAGA